jgi:hypothetical protein
MDARASSSLTALGLRSRTIEELILRSRIFSFPRSEEDVSAPSSIDPDDDLRETVLGRRAWSAAEPTVALE